ncbi:subtilase-type protease inhibitor [Lentisalinibacter salinarum]|uniref:hypothetical protein n=1 Tax=Lentisalinibacter salinarum TaxID=2992239 RepID=UPI00386D6FC9
MRHLLTVFLLLGLVACGGDGDEPMPVEPDGGIGDGAGPPPDAGGLRANLQIVIESSDQSVSVTYALMCEGDRTELQGTVHVDPARACAALSDPAVRERLVEGAPQDRMCTKIYGGPETATVRGSIDGRPVDTVIRRSDGCGMDDWDRLLANILMDVEDYRRSAER